MRGLLFTATSSFLTKNSPQKSKPTNSSLRMISSRGEKVVGYLPTYLADSRNAPEGALQLSIAETYLMEKELITYLNGLNSKKITLQPDIIYYQSTQGRESLRNSFTSMLQDTILNSNYKLDPEKIVLGAGCNAVLENLCFLLADPGDSVLIPEPYYAAFEYDLAARIDLKVVGVHLSNEGTEFSDPSTYYPTAETLDEAYHRSQKAGNTPKILLISHPNNPLGINYPEHVLLEVMQWASDRNVHLVSDEIYAGSVHRKPTSSNNNDCVKFTSIADVALKKKPSKSLGDSIHIVYALSKDFGLSGLRVGAVYTEYEDIIVPLQKLNDLCQISSQTQVLVEEMSKDISFVNDFLSEHQRRILARVEQIEAILKRLDVPFLKAEAGLFMWLDLREFLSSDLTGDEAERSLYLELMNYGLLFTPGRSMRMKEPGFFRLVFTAAREEQFEEALERIESFIVSKR